MRSPSTFMKLVVLHPIIDLGLSQAQDVLGGVGGGLTAMYVQEVQASGGLEQDLLVAGRIAKVTDGVLLDQSSGLGVILLLADDLLHGTNLLSHLRIRTHYTGFSFKIKSKKLYFR